MTNLGVLRSAMRPNFLFLFLFATGLFVGVFGEDQKPKLFVFGHTFMSSWIG